VRRFKKVAASRLHAQNMTSAPEPDPIPVCFGNEDISHLLSDARFMRRCVLYREKGVADFIMMRHFDLDYPLHNNLRFLGTNSACFGFSDGKKRRWNTIGVAAAMDTMIGSTVDELERYYNTIKDTMDKDPVLSKQSANIRDFMERRIHHPNRRAKHWYESIVRDVYGRIWQLHELDLTASHAYVPSRIYETLSKFGDVDNNREHCKALEEFAGDTEL
jgi:hypothetical protein